MRQRDRPRQLTPVRHHRRDADPPAAPAAGQVDQVLVEFALQFGRVDVAPRSVRLLGAGLVAVGVVRGARTCRRRCRASSRRPAPRPGRAAPVRRPDPAARQRDSARPRRRSECPTTTTGASASASSSPASAATLASRSTAPPRTSARGRAGPVRRSRTRADAGSPASASAGRARSIRGWPGSAAGRGRAVAVHMQDIGHAVDAARCRPGSIGADLSDPRGVMPACPHRTPNCRPTP